MACETVQQKITHKGRENGKVWDIWRQEGNGECVWNSGKQIQDLTGHIDQRLEVVRVIVLTCVYCTIC